MRRLTLTGLLVAVAVMIFIAGSVLILLRGRERSGAALRDSSVVVQQIRTLCELVTVKYVLENVVIAQDVRWYGENRVILLAHGVAKAGIDLAALKPEDVTVSGGRLEIRLPEARLTDVYLDEGKTQIIERSTGVLREFDKDLEQNARREAVQRLRSAALAAGITKDAKDRARLQLEGFFHQLGFEQVEIE